MRLSDQCFDHDYFRELPFQVGGIPNQVDGALAHARSDTALCRVRTSILICTHEPLWRSFLPDALLDTSMDAVICRLARRERSRSGVPIINMRASAASGLMPACAICRFGKEKYRIK